MGDLEGAYSRWLGRGDAYRLSSWKAQIARGLLFGLAALATLAAGFLFIFAVSSDCTEEQYGSDLCAAEFRWALAGSAGFALSFIVGLAQAAWGRQYRYFFRAVLVGTVLTAGVVATGRFMFN